MKKNTPQLNTQVERLNQQLRQLSKQQDSLKSMLHLERQEGQLDDSVLDQSLAQALSEKSRVCNKMDKEKSIIKNRKSEIKQWKTNFENNEYPDKSEELIQLQEEISWRAKEISAIETTIAELYQTKNDLTGIIESINIKKIIVAKGFHKNPVSEDPRLLGLLEEKKF